MIFDGKKATGVQAVTTGGKTDEWRTLTASKGVILSAGYAQSPKILTLSGVASENRLTDLNVSSQLVILNFLARTFKVSND